VWEAAHSPEQQSNNLSKGEQISHVITVRGSPE
jgi:hypothetical protein